MKNRFAHFWRSVKLPLLAFTLAILSGGLLIAFSDPKVIALWKSPGKLLSEGFRCDQGVRSALSRLDL